MYRLNVVDALVSESPELTVHWPEKMAIGDELAQLISRSKVGTGCLQLR